MNSLPQDPSIDLIWADLWWDAQFRLVGVFTNLKENRKGGKKTPVDRGEGVLVLKGESFAVQVHCFASTETIRTTRGGEPSTATATFTQLLSSESFAG